MRRAPVVLLATLLALPAALALAAASGKSRRLTLLTVLYPLAEWAAQVGGDRVTVQNLAPAGADPHDFEPTPADLRRLRQADVVLTLGKGFQPAVDRALGARSDRQVRLVATEGLAFDPHVWLDPVLARQVVGRIAAALATADPAGTAIYEANARAYQARLDALHERYGRTLAACAHRTLVTSHAAFGHLAARYDLEQAAIRGISPEAEPTPRRLAELARFVKQRGIKYIFTETIVSPRVAETLARETGAKTLVLHTLESLSGEEVARGKDYLGVMEDNLRALATGLECRVW